MTTHGDLHPRALAEAGYRGYGDWADWTNYSGGAMPSWRELPEPQRQAWVAAADSIRRVLLTHADDDRPRSAYEASHPMMCERSTSTPVDVEQNNSGGRA